MLRIVVLVSGGGTNLQAIIDGIREGIIRDTEIAAVISNNKSAYALERAKMVDIPCEALSPKDFDTREAYNDALFERVQSYHVDLIVLAGFLVMIPEAMIDAYENRIINIHPSLIPSFCGVGYYGIKVHEAAIARGVKISGATVHFVDKGADTGPIIMQKAVEVRAEDTPQELQQRIMEQAEWILLPQVIDAIAAGRVSVVDGQVVIQEK